jgi:hypothetical protein
MCIMMCKNYDKVGHESDTDSVDHTTYLMPILIHILRESSLRLRKQHKVITCVIHFAIILNPMFTHNLFFSFVHNVTKISKCPRVGQPKRVGQLAKVMQQWGLRKPRIHWVCIIGRQRGLNNVVNKNKFNFLLYCTILNFYLDLSSIMIM